MAKENDDPGTRVVFKMHAELNDTKTKEAGRPIYDEFEMVEISFAGNRSTIFCAPALSYAGWGEDPITSQRTQITYAQKYSKEYRAFKEGNQQTLSGTPLEELTFLTMAKRLELKALNIYTAEALAGLDGNNLKMLGMGGRDLKNQAQAYLDAAAKNGDALHLAAELDKRDTELAELRAQVASLMAGPSAEPEVKTEVVAAFDTFSDEDLINWLKEAGIEPDGRWGRKRLLDEAGKIIDKQGKKKAA